MNISVLANVKITDLKFTTIKIMENNEQTRISRISIGRVFNLGNYENIRYEISADIGASDNPADVLRVLEKAINDLRAKSDVDGYDLKRARDILAKPASELDEFDVKNLETYKAKLEKHENALKLRAEAREVLGKFGLNQTFTDAKDNWVDDDDY